MRRCPNPLDLDRHLVTALCVGNHQHVLVVDFVGWNVEEESPLALFEHSTEQAAQRV